MDNKKIFEYCVADQNVAEKALVRFEVWKQWLWNILCAITVHIGNYIHYHVLHIFFSKSLTDLIKERILSHPLKLGFNYLICSDLVIEAAIDSNVTNRNSVFIRLSNISLCVCIDICICIYTHIFINSSVDGHTGCFHILTI